MSSHREAPQTAMDPVADNTDLYAFTSPERPDTVTIIANFIPFEDPAGGPNFYNFGNDVRYEIKIDNNGDAIEDIVYEFRFKTQFRNPNTFLYNTGPITSLDSPNWNIRQTYSIQKVTIDPSKARDDLARERSRETIAENLVVPPCRIGPRSTPNYENLANAAIHNLPGGGRVFAGQRDDPFFVDLGSIFDLGTLRPFQHLHLSPSAQAMGRDDLSGYNVHSIILQIPKNQLTRDGRPPTDVMAAQSVIGVWSSASRQRLTIRFAQLPLGLGPWVQVSRLGNPLINEVVIAAADKDAWNVAEPVSEAQFAARFTKPELAQLLPVLYPNVFPKLAALNASGAPRADLVAILGTGIPAGLVPGFQNFTGATVADMLRLNMAIPPTTNNPSPLGLAAGDAAGFPNGRRPFDDVVTIELRAVAGLLYNLIDKNFTADDAVSQITDGTLVNDKPFFNAFPYLAHPHEGYSVGMESAPA